MATYVYARPSIAQELYANLFTYPLRIPTNYVYVDFTYSLDANTALRVYLWRKKNKLGQDEKLILWEKTASYSTQGIQLGRAQIPNILNDEFRLVFTAKVKPAYPFSFRTYLSQVVIERVVVYAT